MSPLPLTKLASPALLFKESSIDYNLDLMVELAGDSSRLRPHVKTHKCPNIIARHIQRGITKFKCATIAEAEMVAKNGATSLILAKQPVGPDIARIIELAVHFPDTEVLAIVDNEGSIIQLAQALSASTVRLGLLADVDCGMARTGIAPGPALYELYSKLVSEPRIEASGFHVYDGHIHDADLATRRSRSAQALANVLATKRELEKQQRPVPRLVAGGSPTFVIHAANPAVTECSPGTTVLWDTGYQDAYPDLPFKPAAFVMTRVISRLSEDAVCVDLGHKAISADKPQPRVRFDRLPEAVLETHSEEHLVIRSPHCQDLEIGEALIGIPQHICPTVALYDHASILNEHDEVIDRWPIEARTRQLTI